MIFNPLLFIITLIFHSSVIVQTNQLFVNDYNTKQKIKACISLHKLKFSEEKELMGDFLKKMTKLLKRDEHLIIYLALAICVDKINSDDALKINHRTENNKMINIYNQEIKKFYDLDKYDYSNQTNNAHLFNNFIPVFDKIYEEIEEENQNFFKKKYIYFLHTPLFKCFIIYTIINTIIIFVKRFNRKNKIDFDNNNEIENKNCQCTYHRLKKYKKEEEEDNNSDKEENDKNEENKNENEIKENKVEFRKLNKKGKIGRRKS